MTSPTGSTSIPITVTFSEDVTGFISSDITATNGTVSGFAQVDAKTYTATITPTASGAVTANIGAGAATDIAGNPNVAAAGFTITFDSTIPGLNITSSTRARRTWRPYQSPSQFTENVTGFESRRCHRDQWRASNFNTINGSNYTATLTPTASGLVSVNVAAGVAKDADNNNNSSAAFSITFDNTAATPTIPRRRPVQRNRRPIPITVTFTENVTGFTASDISVTNGTLSAFAATDGKTYTATLTPTASGVVTLNIAAGTANDSAGNPSAAATAFSITFDNTSPTVAITSTVTARPERRPFRSPSRSAKTSPVSTRPTSRSPTARSAILRQ